MSRKGLRGVLLLAVAGAVLAGQAYAHRALKPDITMRSVVGVWDGLVSEYAVARMEIESSKSGKLWIGWLGEDLRYFDLTNIASVDRSLVLRFATTNPKGTATIRARGNADDVDGRISAEIALDEVNMGGGPFQLFKSNGRSFLGLVADMQGRIEDDVTKRTGLRPADTIRKGSPTRSSGLEL